MKLTLRSRFMAWLTIQTLAALLVLGVALFFFNLHERREHPDQVEEEVEELFIIYGLMLGTLPIMAGVAWGVSGQLLRPLQNILRSAQRIKEGRLEQRIEVAVPHDEIGQISRALNEAFDEYQGALQRLDRFSKDAAHQLRNPLAAIRTTAEVCLQQPRTAAEYQEVLARIMEETRRLNHAVGQLLMLARLGRGAIAEGLEPFDLARLARRTVENYACLMEDRGLRWEAPDEAASVPCHGAPGLIEEALANLLDNAIKFTPAGGIITVAVAIENGRAHLTVSDSGPGFADLPGRRSAEAAQGGVASAKGAGLGLLLVQDIVRAHGGRLEVGRGPHGGASLSLDLPAGGGPGGALAKPESGR